MDKLLLSKKGISGWKNFYYEYLKEQKLNQ